LFPVPGILHPSCVLLSPFSYPFHPLVTVPTDHSIPLCWFFSFLRLVCFFFFLPHRWNPPFFVECRSFLLSLFFDRSLFHGWKRSFSFFDGSFPFCVTLYVPYRHEFWTQFINSFPAYIPVCSFRIFHLLLSPRDFPVGVLTFGPSSRQFLVLSKIPFVGDPIFLRPWRLFFVSFCSTGVRSFHFPPVPSVGSCLFLFLGVCVPFLLFCFFFRRPPHSQANFPRTLC